MEGRKAGSSPATEGPRRQPQPRHMGCHSRRGHLNPCSLQHSPTQPITTQTTHFAKSRPLEKTSSQLSPLVVSLAYHIVSNSTPRRIPRFSDPYHTITTLLGRYLICFFDGEAHSQVLGSEVSVFQREERKLRATGPETADLN
jgi:hypothetical protein